MHVSPLTLTDLEPWAALLAAAFERPFSEMMQVLERLNLLASLVAYGAWDEDTLIAQYSCLLAALRVPCVPTPVPVGISINMAVHPAYRGRGLIKQVAAPVYETLKAKGCAAGVGFSNAAGVRVDRHSRGYGYQVVGKMQPVLAWIYRRPQIAPVQISETWPAAPFYYTPDDVFVRFALTPDFIQYRFVNHPSRHYHFGVWPAGDYARGIVVYRPIPASRPPGVSLLAAYAGGSPMDNMSVDRSSTVNLSALVAGWARAMWERGIRVVRLLATPASPLRAALQQVALCMPLPYSREPYYLTVKPLRENMEALFDFSRWDCAGGDIL
ncbi:MAG: GNAT family N-acetyltransferase [Anaerolineae bacterium]|nr:GNAT family N-acetyltransferase [Anaerolineae bacterium]